VVLVVVNAHTGDRMASVLILVIAGMIVDTESEAALSSQLCKFYHAPGIAVEGFLMGGSSDLHLCCDVHYATSDRSIPFENPFCQVESQRRR
jgi:hypothetical protein